MVMSVINNSVNVWKSKKGKRREERTGKRTPVLAIKHPRITIKW